MPEMFRKLLSHICPFWIYVCLLFCIKMRDF